ncbi:FxDxF family PEP-CTERM protein [Methylotenera sp.]|uniref:FxDxF family PEP-CTERM protein n=1 Tax=Methylotenera sp. TaxID=2051956 RepID=UPI002487EDEF|nr:FxDxF family PEP-CTERM protein [Methylotenera sp.]MDI1298128.1 FxDxF family PEP-CTERM protein [Methylotenera sp.]
MKSLKLNALVLAAGLVAASLSTIASATVVTTPTLSNGYTFGGTFDGASVNDYIPLDFSFSNVTGTLSGSVASKTITFSLFDIVNTATNALVINGTVFGGVAKVDFGFLEGTLGSGMYSLHIAGTATGPKASYAGTLSVSPVPEPETYGMMLAGLGLMGFVARRRKSV